MARPKSQTSMTFNQELSGPLRAIKARLQLENQDEVITMDHVLRYLIDLHNKYGLGSSNHSNDSEEITNGV